MCGKALTPLASGARSMRAVASFGEPYGAAHNVPIVDPLLQRVCQDWLWHRRHCGDCLGRRFCAQPDERIQMDVEK
jgi:hypothetical protein